MNVAGIDVSKGKNTICVLCSSEKTTDRSDSKEIAKYGLANWWELRQYTSMDKRRYQLKVLNRWHSHLTSIRTSLTNSLITTMEMTYPDANKLFTSPAVRTERRNG